MAAKIVLVLCAQALLIQAAFSQIVTGNSAFGSGVSNAYGFGSGFGAILNAGASGSSLGSGISGIGSSVSGPQSLTVASGGPLFVTSISPIGPSGLAVASEHAIEGILTVSGQLPYLSAVAFEGALPTSGSGVATCGCGNGEVGIVSEGLPAIQPANAGRIGRRF
ncbi:chorion class CB protein M5H4-like [Ostrinia nubilalis]|uniref:chorion class CB protein M5H4-like n=1 Tax=Ostrinia nubilalis TaxID=29057 RepID=UPI00308241B8